MKSKHFINSGTERARKLFKNDAYAFPHQFQTDASNLVKESFRLLSSSDSKSKEMLEKYMVQGLASKFQIGNDNLSKQNQSASFSITSDPIIVINSFHFTYGPFPIPPDYVAQDWFEFITIMLPKEDSVFESHPRQNELLSKAEDQGCHFRVNTTVEMEIEFTINNAQSLPLIRDKRQFIDISFTTPHFSPWDQIFDLQSDGTWKLNWDWKIFDIDTKYI
jgi:hypothetical protein